MSGRNKRARRCIQRVNIYNDQCYSSCSSTSSDSDSDDDGSRLLRPRRPANIENQTSDVIGVCWEEERELKRAIQMSLKEGSSLTPDTSGCGSSSGFSRSSSSPKATPLSASKKKWKSKRQLLPSSRCRKCGTVGICYCNYPVYDFSAVRSYYMNQIKNGLLHKFNNYMGVSHAASKPLSPPTSTHTLRALSHLTGASANISDTDDDSDNDDDEDYEENNRCEKQSRTNSRSKGKVASKSKPAPSHRWRKSLTLEYRKQKLNQIKLKHLTKRKCKKGRLQYSSRTRSTSSGRHSGRRSLRRRRQPSKLEDYEVNGHRPETRLKSGALVELQGDDGEETVYVKV